MNRIAKILASDGVDEDVELFAEIYVPSNMPVHVLEYCHGSRTPFTEYFWYFNDTSAVRMFR